MRVLLAVILAGGLVLTAVPVATAITSLNSPLTWWDLDNDGVRNEATEGDRAFNIVGAGWNQARLDRAAAATAEWRTNTTWDVTRELPNVATPSSIFVDRATPCGSYANGPAWTCWASVTARLGLGVVVVTGFAAAAVLGGTPRDRNGIPIAPDARQLALDAAAGRSVVDTCILSGQTWGPFPPTAADVVAADARGPGAWVGHAFTLGPLAATANSRALDVRWSDGSGNRVFAIDHFAELPTVITLVASSVAGHELWQVERVDTVGGCDGDQVPSAIAP